jgi:hypothetical protein
MEATMIAVTHDAGLCKCDVDNGCSCPCPKCRAYIAARVQGMRLLALEERLKNAGIEIEDFADLIWAHMEATIEARMERIAKQEIAAGLKGLKLISAVKWSSIEN